MCFMKGFSFQTDHKTGDPITDVNKVNYTDTSSSATKQVRKKEGETCYTIYDLCDIVLQDSKIVKNNNGPNHA